MIEILAALVGVLFGAGGAIGYERTKRAKSKRKGDHALADAEKKARQQAVLLAEKQKQEELAEEERKKKEEEEKKAEQE